MALRRSQLPPPVRFVITAYRAIRTVPGAVVLRGLYEAFAYLSRLALLFVVGLALVIGLATQMKSGQPLEAWPAALASMIRQPAVLIGVGGVAFTGWLLIFAVEAWVFGGMWSATRDALTADEVQPWAAWRGAFASFPDAVKVRVLVRATELMLASVTVGTLVIAASLARAAGLWTASTLLAPSLTWALLLTCAASGAVVIRFAAEMVAAPVYIDRVGLGEAMLRAARTVVDHPIYIYRLFVVSAAVLLGPMMLAWLAALFQNVLVTSGNQTLAGAFQVAAQGAILLGLALFSVMLHATFFTYYAWANQRIDRARILAPGTIVELEQLLPKSYAVVVSVDDVLGDWDENDVLPIAEPSTPPPPPRVAGPYDLGAILTTEEEE